MEDRAKIAVSTHEGHYKYNCIPFDVINAPSTFQSIINQTLRELVRNEHFAYHDNTVIFSFDTHLKTKITYLGHVIPKRRISPNFEKLKQFTNFQNLKM